MALKFGHFGRDQKYLESSEIWCWNRREKISCTDCVRNEEVLHRVKEDRNIVHTLKRGRLTGLVICCVGTAFWNTLLKERIEVMERGGRRVKQLLDDLKERRAHWKLKEEALDRTLWRTGFGSDYGLVVRQTAE